MFVTETNTLPQEATTPNLSLSLGSLVSRILFPGANSWCISKVKSCVEATAETAVFATLTLKAVGNLLRAATLSPTALISLIIFQEKFSLTNSNLMYFEGCWGANTDDTKGGWLPQSLLVKELGSG